MELTFGDDDVYAEITAHFVPLKFDVTSSSDENFDRRSRYSADTLPAVVFMGVDGSVLGRVRKMTEPDDMLKIVQPEPIQRGDTSGPPSTIGPGSACAFCWITRPNPSE